MMRKRGETIYGNHPDVLACGRDFKAMPEDNMNVGKYGEMRGLWLKEQNMRAEQEALIATGQPNKELAMFNVIAATEVNRIWQQLMKADKANEPKPSVDYWGHVGWMERHKATAEEIVIQEMVCVK